MEIQWEEKLWDFKRKMHTHFFFTNLEVKESISWGGLAEAGLGGVGEDEWTLSLGFMLTFTLILSLLPFEGEVLPESVKLASGLGVVKLEFALARGSSSNDRSYASSSENPAKFTINF